ncbi:hypothetical protein [Paraburkholderia sp. J63]|uniref:hypothetical protein n=1 Tax=Paraburkholderia sp. J63 TaxID=2805434 RepID=UPI002ABE8CCF|nr:hypothetical protein [Paraburkholderia sp. J63]
MLQDEARMPAASLPALPQPGESTAGLDNFVEGAQELVKGPALRIEEMFQAARQHPLSTAETLRLQVYFSDYQAGITALHSCARSCADTIQSLTQRN